MMCIKGVKQTNFYCYAEKRNTKPQKITQELTYETMKKKKNNLWSSFHCHKIKTLL